MSNNSERSIQQIIIDSDEHYANLEAYLTTDEHQYCSNQAAGKSGDKYLCEKRLKNE